jgi:hypothetical protein
MKTIALQNFADFLEGHAQKHTDALFVRNLITEIEKRPKICVNAVDRWLKSAFSLPPCPDNDNCIDVYNRSFYHQLLEKLDK